MMRKFALCMVAMLSLAVAAFAQNGSAANAGVTDSTAALSMLQPDTIELSDSVTQAAELTLGEPESFRRKSSPYKFKPLQLIAPVALIGAGIIGLESDWLKYQNSEIRDELQEHGEHKFTIDNLSQYSPIAATYALNLLGVKGKHGYADLTIILGTAYALMAPTVYGMKSITKVKRPDGSTANSFPSGHTATAFLGAEILRREYWDVSPWIGVAGYAVAAGTGFLRIYNNRHWLTDVIGGAGVGILAAQAAYWLYPWISKTFFHKQYLKNTYLSPYVDSDSKGVSCVIRF